MRTQVVCAHCGSRNVVVDAYAQWDEEKQEFEVVQTFDKGAFCADCDDHTRVNEIPIEDITCPSTT